MLETVKSGSDVLQLQAIVYLKNTYGRNPKPVSLIHQQAIMKYFIEDFRYLESTGIIPQKVAVQVSSLIGYILKQRIKANQMNEDI